MKKENLPDSISVVWKESDVRHVRPDLNPRKAREVLAYLNEHHDPHIGICWDVLSITAELLFPKTENNKKGAKK